MDRALEALRASAADCHACDLWSRATQTVFGEGPTPAPMMLIGEQPGDEEDRSGRPFVGPAGRVLDQALREAGIERSGLYVTNVVKHFKWKPRGKRRIHDKPNRTEVAACHRWLAGELDLARPEVLVVLGATAAQALFGTAFRVSRECSRDLTATTLAPPLARTGAVGDLSAAEIDAYLERLDDPKRSTLSQLRHDILAVIPDAEQCLSYAVPAFKVSGKTVAGFAAFKNHLSYLPHSGSVFPELPEDRAGYEKSSGALRFPVDQALSPALVEKLIGVRMRQAFPSGRTVSGGRSHE